ncbi:hypothetical protein M3231_08080 [Neobacillus mesonae]|nr:hypothetical protein [Neobacillus mesonae]
MIRNRSFLFGLGSGIVVGALILQLALIGQGQAGVNNTEDPSSLTREQLEEAADELQLKVYDAATEVMTEEEWTDLKASENSSQSTGNAASEPEVSEPQQPAAPDNKEPTEPEQASEPASEPISYRVINGATLTDVADHLSALHVIEDREAFLKEATKQKINKKIQVGTFQFTEAESIDSVIQKLIAEP